MIRIKKFLIFLLIILFFFTACSNKSLEPITELKITGDLEEELILKSNDKNLNWQKLEIDNKNYNSINLDDLFFINNYSYDDYSILFIANDGMKVKIDNNFNKINLYTDSKGWNVYGPDFPPTVNLKELDSIVFIKKNIDLSNSVNIINQNENLIALTPGNMHLMNLVSYNYFDGESVKNDDYRIEAYKEKLLLQLQDIVEEDVLNQIIMTYDGGYYYTSNKGFLQLQGNKINYIEPNNRTIYFDIAGTIINPPSHSIMDVFNDSKYYLDKNEKVMLIFIDGFSYGQYKYALDNNYIPCLSTIENVQPALSVYKPVTNCGYATMISGQPPYINGILNRDYREIKVDTIFDYIKDIDKKSLIVEGNTNVISTHGDPLLNTDSNSNGYNDDEVFSTAIENIDNVDYAFIHFHGFDDAGHNFGDLNKNTMLKLKEIDSYVNTLISKWQGIVIITSDHGMHSTNEGGNHGDFRYEDLIVPYIITDGGLQE